ncbi:OpgC domain-containing protein [Cellulomonas endophytica]|uniref:OpgC domain-containing protein n=1 Tax=Cellulomonas endophytica TaxID=2494735 RepID=UPI001010A28A|nr:OpgC domain-containing protein [Cellulomonas endophytica]
MNVPGVSTSSRLAQIDIIRGYCIASMVAGHVAPGSRLSWALHAFPFFDGASGFVMLSGLVLGIVQHKRLERDGLRSVQVKTARRLGLIYVAQVAITLVALAMVPLARLQHENLPPVEGSGPVEVVARVLGLALAPPVGSVLRLYIVILALAMLAYWLLRRGLPLVVLGGSLALYVVGQVAPQWTSFTANDGVTRGASWAGWQLLFMLTLLVGWHWRQWDVPALLRTRRWAWLGGSVLVIVAAEVLGPRLPGLYEKVTLGPGRIVTAFAVVVLLYVLLDVVLAAVPLARTLLRPVERIGQRSLDSYIIQAVVIVLLLSFVTFSTSGLVGTALALGILGLCWGWAELRRWRSARSVRPALVAASA